MKTMPSSSDWLAPQSISFSGPLPLLSFSSRSFLRPSSRPVRAEVEGKQANSIHITTCSGSRIRALVQDALCREAFGVPTQPNSQAEAKRLLKRLSTYKSMWAVSWILVRPVEIESRCQSADTGPDSGYSLVLECFEQNEFEESHFNWKMTCKSVGGVTIDPIVASAHAKQDDYKTDPAGNSGP
jgi:hypothetical protein